MIYEFLQKKPLGQSYKTFCNTIGTGIVEYKDFEISFEKFAKEMFDFNEKKPIVKEKCSTENPPSFTDFSDKILGRIVDKLGLVDRLVLRKVSRNLRNIIDDQKVICGLIDIVIQDCTSSLTFESNPPINYTRKCNETSCEVEYGGKKKYLVGEDHLECLIRDIGSFMRNPKFELKILKTEFGMGIPFLYDIHLPQKERPKERIRQLEAFFKGLGFQLHVNSFNTKFEIHCERTEPVMAILPYLKPGILSNIYISTNFDFHEMMRKVMKLDQWKQAIKPYYKMGVQQPELGYF